MDGPRLPSQLLLLVIITGALGLDALSGSPVPAPNSSRTLESHMEIPEDLDEDTRYRMYAEVCQFSFVHQMANVSKAHLCEWRVISRPYSNLRYCLESIADSLNYSYPNALADNYTTFTHRMYFVNCTLEHPPLVDPPKNILLSLIIMPICLIPFLVALVVWNSKDGEMKS